MTIYKILLLGDEVLFRVLDKKNKDDILISFLDAKNTLCINELFEHYSEEKKIEIISPVLLGSFDINVESYNMPAWEENATF